jgi:hypothetical protein
MRWLGALAAIVLFATACSSGPCQANPAHYNCGDCLMTNNICDPPPPDPARRAACEMDCASSADQTVLNNLVNCANQIPNQVGTCASSTQLLWFSSVVAQLYDCVRTYGPQLSTNCAQSILSSYPDAG